ncbi:MAG: biosynthetic-type acetolactate synthase large subunit [Victivallales bacterium]|nr:biosynthetic-type acetolactate synthase large subunit [Victivallales bacterium]
MQMTGAKILLECLLEQDVDTIFGYPGGSILNVYDELYHYADRIRHILTSHEQGAGHAADGYARSTGKVGVCLATSGPGATNLTTAIATALLDSSPVVFISCNVPESLIGKDSFQEVDMTGISMPITKCNFQVNRADRLADTVREAFAIARSGRPGPVFIDILKNATQEKAEYTPLPRKEHFAYGSLATLIHRASHDFQASEPDADDLDKLVGMIRVARRPMLICGGGVVLSRAQEEFEKFAVKLDAPSAFTVMGCGGIRSRHPLATGLVGMHGTRASNMAVANCDLLIAVGCRFSDRVALAPNSFAKQAKIVQIDIDRAEIDKNVPTAHHIIGDAHRVLELMNAKVRQCSHRKWKQFVFSFPVETQYEKSSGATLNPKLICDCIAGIAPRDSIISTDVGQHQMWCVQNLKFDYPGQLLTSGGFGTMGFGLGAAIGAKIGNPDKTVIHVTGDGSFRMNCNELATEEFYHLPIVTIIFNNTALGMVRQWQRLTLNGRYSQTTLAGRTPDFVKLAGAYGLEGERVGTVAQLERALRKALACGHGYVIDCAISIDEMVRPMVQDGCPIDDFLLD